MPGLRLRTGLSPRFKTAPLAGPEVHEQITEEAGLTASGHADLRVDLLVAEGDAVAQGAPVARLRDAPSICLVAPMPAHVARIRLNPGRKLSEIVLFHDASGDRRRHAPQGEATDVPIRSLLQQAGMWPMFCRRPFGGMPSAAERPSAIVVMAADSRPLAPDPRLALTGQEEMFSRGLAALTALTDGPVFVCHAAGAPLADFPRVDQRLRPVAVGHRHPNGLAGFCSHALAPATASRPVWDCHAEDVAAVGSLLETGFVPQTRLVQVAGDGLRAGRLVRTQPGADLRGLVEHDLLPGAHQVLSGSPLDGKRAHWLGPRDRQVTALRDTPHRAARHWLLSALSRSALPQPVIPTKALSQAFADALPAAAFVRALSAGDEETATKLGLLSFLAEDMALADYVLGGDAHLAELLTAMLARIEKEAAA